MKIFSVNPLKLQNNIYNKTINSSFAVDKNNVDSFEPNNKIPADNKINFKSKPVYDYSMNILDRCVFGYTKEKQKLTQVLLEPFIESLRDPKVPVPASVLLHGPEMSVIEKFKNAIGHIFTSILKYQLDDISQMPPNYSFNGVITSLLNRYKPYNEGYGYKYTIFLDEPEKYLGMNYNLAKRLSQFEYNTDDLNILNSNNNTENINRFKSLLDHCSKPASEGGFGTTFLFSSKHPHLIHPDIRSEKMEKIEIPRPHDEEAGQIFLALVKDLVMRVEKNKYLHPSEIHNINKLKTLNITNFTAKEIEEIQNYFKMNYLQGAFSYDDLRQLASDTCDTTALNPLNAPGRDCLFNVLINNTHRAYSPEDVIRQDRISALFERKPSAFKTLKESYENGELDEIGERYYHFNAALRDAQINGLELLEKQGKLTTYQKEILRKLREE